MNGFMQQIIPYLRNTSGKAVGEFLTALEDVIELGSRYVLRLGGAAVLTDLDSLLVGPKGIGVAGTSLLIPFDDTLALADRLPNHFLMPTQPPARYRRTAFGYVCGVDRTFGMIARDDEMEPGRHSREALTDAIATMKRTAEMKGRSPVMTIYPAKGGARVTEGLLIGEEGFRSPMGTDTILWNDVTMFEIADRVRLTCTDAVVEVSC